MIKIDMKRSINKEEIQRVLIRATNWVGDMVISLPAIEAVRELFPDRQLIVLAKPWVIPLIANNPSIDRIFPYDRGPGILSEISEFINILKKIRKEKFDLAVLFQNAFEAALLSYMAGIKYRLGYNVDGRGFLLTHGISKSANKGNLHQVDYYLNMLRCIGWEGKARDPQLHVGKEEELFIHSLLTEYDVQSKDLLIGLSPGAIYGPAKRWPAERFAEVGDRAAEEWGARIFILGSDGERDICDKVAERMKHTAIDLCGKTTLGQAMAFIKRCDYFISNDSGLMHVAAALDVPMIAIFGSTDHVATGPLNKRARVLRKEVECSPCLKSVCPTDFKCMLEIEPEDVWNELKILREEIE